MTPFFQQLNKRLTSIFIGVLLMAGCLFLATPMAHATKLPAGVVNYLEGKDENVQIRFDGFIIFSNGESYLPVLSQDPELKSDALQVIQSIPEISDYPDLIQFDNNTFLLRLIQTNAGRLTIVPLGDYPFALKTGMLPQDLVLPKNFFVPTELKIILGELPYNPELPSEATPITPLAETLTASIPDKKAAVRKTNLIYTYSLDDQTLVGASDKTGRIKHKIDIGCIPSQLKVSTKTQLLYAPCMSGEELVVVDMTANLVKTRIPLSSKPNDLLLLEDNDLILVTHAFEKKLTVIDTKKLLPGESIDLPSEGGVMARFSENVALIADGFSEKVYLFDLREKMVKREMVTLPNISGLWVTMNRSRRPELWVVGQKDNTANMYDLISGKLVKSFATGDKPVDIGAYDNRLFILSTRSATIDVIDFTIPERLSQIQLPEDSYPTELSTDPNQSVGYISSSNQDAIFQLDMEKNQISKTIPSGFRSLALAFAQGGDDLEEETSDFSDETPLTNNAVDNFFKDDVSLNIKETEKAVLKPKRKSLFNLGSDDGATLSDSQANSQADSQKTSEETPVSVPLAPIDDQVITKEKTAQPDATPLETTDTKNTFTIKNFFGKDKDSDNTEKRADSTTIPNQKKPDTSPALPPMLELN